MSINQVSEEIRSVIKSISNGANGVEQLLLETYERVNEVLGQKDEKEIKDILIDYKEDGVELVEGFRPKKIDTKGKIEKEAENGSDRISYFIEQWFPNINYQNLSLKDKILLMITYGKVFKDDESFEEKTKNINRRREKDQQNTLNFIFQNGLGIRNIEGTQYNYQYQIGDINKARELRRGINRKDEFYVVGELRRFDSFLQSYKNGEEEIAYPVIIRIIELLEERKKEQGWRGKIKKNWKWYFG